MGEGLLTRLELEIPLSSVRTTSRWSGGGGGADRDLLQERDAA